MKYSANALIAAAKRDTPRATLEGEVIAALGTAALGASFAMKLWAALKHAAVTKAGIATIAFAAATGGYAAGRLQERAEHPAAPMPVPTLALTRTPTPTLTSTSTSPATNTIASTSTSTRGAAVVATATTTATPSPPPPQVSLADEVAAIKRARAAVLSKDATTAIAALNDYDQAHPDGKMTEEALALRVRADRLAGDDVGAAEALTKLETRFPESIHLASLRR